MSTAVAGQRWLLGVCGVVGAVTTPQHVVYLRQMGIDVRVALSRNASRFVSVDVLEAVSGHKVHGTVFDRADGISVPHVELPAMVDAFVVMPASAAVIAGLAHGHADDLITASALCCEVPILVVPSLNDVMWTRPAVRRNLAQLEADGMRVLHDPEGSSIEVADASQRAGAMPGLADVIEAVTEEIAASSPG